MYEIPLSELAPERGWIKLDSPRLLPLKNEELSLGKKLALKIMLRVGKARCPNLFRTMFRNFRVFLRFAAFNATVMPNGKLSRRHTELAILRVAWKTRSYYEWSQHVEIGLRIGLTSSDIHRVTLGPEANNWTQVEAVIIQTVDELIDDKAISSETWDTLSAYLDERLKIELMFLVASYNSLASILNSVGIQLEPDVERVVMETNYIKETLINS